MKTSQRLMSGLFAGLLVIGAAGCSDDSDSDDNAATSTTAATDAGSTTPASSGATASVPIENFKFNPATLTVKVGTTVTWTNRDDMAHTVTSGANRTSDGKFDRALDKGETFSYTFTQAGTFEYYCKPHPNMVAKVVVQP